MSDERVNSVKASGRFGSLKWVGSEQIETTTMDSLIAQFGRPRFLKIDVEGFELQVIQGLHMPVEFVSFEFTPEILSPTIEVVGHLSGLGNCEFNYSLGESMQLASESWVSKDKILSILSNLPDKNVFGDVYARTSDQPSTDLSQPKGGT